MTRTNARRLVAETMMVTEARDERLEGSMTVPSPRGSEGRLVLEAGLDVAARAGASDVERGAMRALADDQSRRTLVFGHGEIGVVERISPATFDGGTTMAGTSVPGLESCPATTGWDWIDDWKSAFLGLTRYREAAYLQQRQGAYTFYPGSAAYYGTGTNARTYLGACNGDSADALMVTIQRRAGAQWVAVAVVAVGSYERFTFYGGLPASYRGWVRGSNGSVVERYGVGAAWTPTRAHEAAA